MGRIFFKKKIRTLNPFHPDTIGEWIREWVQRRLLVREIDSEKSIEENFSYIHTKRHEGLKSKEAVFLDRSKNT